MLCALIMAGGKGTRFWPLSTEEKPKQFLNLIGEETMIQMTVNRVRSIIPIERIFVCTGERYVGLVKEQLPELSERNIIVEPEGRNTTPCIALSAFIIKRYYKDSNMVVLPSDHIIKDEDEFRNIVLSADEFIKNNNEAIITLGMKPTRAETGYGYIRYSHENQITNNRDFIRVEAFVEKPNKEKAEVYINEGNYLWNGGMFLWSIDNILNNIKKYSPNTYEALHLLASAKEEQIQKIINNNYKNTESISIDYSVLERSKNIYVVPSEFGWDDVGNWQALDRYREKDVNDNIITKNVKVIESKSNMAINNNKRIVMIGIEDTMAVETEDTIFIVNKEYMEDIKKFKDFIEN
ncbi:mannose-1-phosphate guanylyltransferase [Clostridium sartagoforme]|uniref:mannose-1-phosphate guanylyltransferase n=1 Tax=Clostridium sartagoforme TaxID=84031 RepID=UPI0031DB0525